jgi:hypothetical protein
MATAVRIRTRACRLLPCPSLCCYGSPHLACSTPASAVACFAHASAHAVAAELDPKYCKVLRKRAATEGSSSSGGGETRPLFEVLCKRYEQALGDKHWADVIGRAEVFTWWAQKPMRNDKVLGDLQGALIKGSIRRDAQAVFLYDPNWPREAKEWEWMRSSMAWWERVPFDESSLCQAQRSQHAAHWHERGAKCSRAKGAFIVTGTLIANWSRPSASR